MLITTTTTTFGKSQKLIKKKIIILIACINDLVCFKFSFYVIFIAPKQYFILNKNLELFVMVNFKFFIYVFMMRIITS